MKTNFTIKEMIDKYSEYLKSENLSKKKTKKALNKFKIDLVDEYSTNDFYLMESKLIEDVYNKIKDSVIIDKKHFEDFLDWNDQKKSDIFTIKYQNTSKN